MPRLALTDRFVTGAKTNGAPQIDYFDKGIPGLALRVTSAGVKTWTLIFTSPRDGKRARMTLGRYPQTGLAVARTKALEAKAHLDDGDDPRDVSAEPSSNMTVAMLIASYMDKHARPNLRGADALDRMFKKDVIPIIGETRLADLHRRDATRVIDKILERKRPIEAARTFAYLRALFRWAVSRGDLDHSPMDGMKKPSDSTPRERVLSDDEIRTLWNGLPKSLARSTTCQRIVKLCLVTGQRVGEVAGMRPAELDLKKRLWMLPGERTKNGHAHTVHLSEPAVAIIEEATTGAGDSADYVFPNDAGEGSFDVRAVAHTIRRANQPSEDRPNGRFDLAPWTPHDLRRTAATGMAKLGIAPIVIGNVLNHRTVTKAGVTLSVYSHYDYAKEKCEALDLWAERLSGIVAAGANVMLMTKKGRQHA